MSNRQSQNLRKYRTVALSTLTACNNQYRPSPQLASSQTGAPYALNSNSPFSTPSTPWQLPSSSVCINVTILGTTCKGNHVFVLLGLAYYTLDNVFKVRPCRSMCHSLLFNDFVYTSYFVYLCFHKWTLGILPPFGYCE